MPNHKVENLLKHVGDFTRADFLAAAAEMLAQAHTEKDRQTARLLEEVQAHAREVAEDAIFAEELDAFGERGDAIGAVVTDILAEDPPVKLPYALRQIDREALDDFLSGGWTVEEGNAVERCVRRCLEVRS